MAIITPYDNKIAVWHHKGQAVGEATIDDLARSIRRNAPAVSQVFVKTSDGTDWMVRYDNKASMAIDGPAAIRRWVTALQKYGLEFHAWCVPRGLDVDGEASIITQTCQAPGVRSIILDVEPYQGFYQGGRDTVRPLMTRIRAALPGAFHIGMAVDPRASHYAEIFPDEWFPFVNSVHLQLYWGTFKVTPDKALSDGYSAWSGYNRPLFPVLQGHRVDATSMIRARTLAVNTYGATGISWWVLGQIGPDQFPAINHYLDGTTQSVPPGADGSNPQYGDSITVSVGGAGYADGAFPGVPASLATFKTYTSGLGGAGKYHATDDHVANVWARWEPHITKSGWYTVEAFVPNQHATTGKARYKMHGVKGQPGEVILTLPQAYYNNEWAPLGDYEIDAAAEQPGVIFLNDWTFEPGLELAFDALRWRPIVGVTAPGDVSGIISGITVHAREIFLKGKQLGNRANVFSRVGDSISASPLFLTPIGLGQYDLGPYRDELAPVLNYFSQANARTGNSFANAPLAAGNGWGADRILQPGYAYTDVCGNDTPLICEYKHVKPSVALIMIGTNDSGGVAPTEYAANLRRIIEISINMGVIPVISTIPPKHVDAWNNARVDEWNTIIRNMARQYDIPLWDYWLALQKVPNQGIDSDGIHPSAPPDGATGKLTGDYLSYGYTIRNLTALKVLNAIWRQALY
jgi:GDSL-like Lipase/Acylhydrolase family